MITFVMVNPSKEIESSLNYVPAFLNSISSQTGIVKNCTIFDKSENEWEAKIETGNSNLYFGKFALYTYNGIKQLSVVLQPQKDMHFDDHLHDLKIVLKENLKKDWDQILWLTDEQSSRFAEVLYGRIYRVENELRNFINMVMVKKLGAYWWDKYVPEEVQNKHKSRQGTYKRLAVSFQNVNDHLMAIDTDDLLTVMTNVLYKWEPVHNNDIEKLIKKTSLTQGEIIKLTESLKSQLSVEVKIWDSLFKPYLSDSFLLEWENFSKNRNHIAHNKLIDKIANEKISENINSVGEMIQKASEKFSMTEISDEDREQLEILSEFIDEDAKYRAYERDGVEVRSEKQILELFESTLMEFISDIADQLYFSPDLDVEYATNPKLERLVIIELLRISHRINDTVITLKSTLKELSGEPGESSILELKLLLDEQEIGICEISNSNGEVEWNLEESYYQQIFLGEFKTNELDDFRNTLFSTISTEIKNYKKAYLKLKNRIGKRPSLHDFIRHQSIDPVVVARSYLTYYHFLLKIGEAEVPLLNEYEQKVLRMLTAEILDGKRRHEIMLLDLLIRGERVKLQDFIKKLRQFNCVTNEQTMSSVESVLDLSFFVKSQRERYGSHPLCTLGKDGSYILNENLKSSMDKNNFFRDMIIDLIECATEKANDYISETPLTLYKKYTRKDVCKLLNWECDESSVVYGYKIKFGTCLIFINYYNNYDSDYCDKLLSPSLFKWFTRSNRTLESEDVKKITDAQDNNIDIHIFVKKADDEGHGFHYLGKASPDQRTVHQSMIKINDKEIPVVSMNMVIETPIEYKFYQYLRSGK
ncbi:DUF3427 domain-containing protein [Paenibacillus kribbensis]|uniref:DUF3427 domain-containing protein n=1 Tax=Paenibacillus kribbensis TaxID=172713 RepID=UPI000838C698|nr:DUF3427 domain-containing protein [Paenibacillus kribbensis]